MALKIHLDAVETTPLPSATVMVLRDQPDGLQVLLLRRHAQSGELGGAHVFPGGKLDPGDALARLPGWSADAAELALALGEPELLPSLAWGLHVAAWRETQEECGLCLEPSQLRPWSRWITPRQPSVTRKRFDTRFFVAPAPDHQHAVHDDHETTEVLWVSPAQALRQLAAGVIDLAPPQIMSLAELLPFASVAQALSFAGQRKPPLIEPEPFDEDGARVICYPGDPRHSVCQPVWSGPTRLRFNGQRFEPEGGLAAWIGA